MSKSRKSRKSKSKAQETKAPRSRREVLKLIRNGAVGVAAIGGAGYWASGSFRAYAAEHDLSRVGQGAPVVVQIHDPQCPTCTALQKQTRAAFESFEDCGLIYLVADIKTSDGAAFAARFGVPHVTLLFFDGEGQRLRTVSGMHSRAQLEPMFAQLKEATQT
ncbi:MAG: thioredoxin family protein [Roseobacter sp.]